MIRKLAFLMVALLFAALPALAAEVGGVKLDDKASVGGQELVLNGAGIRTKADLQGLRRQPLRAGEGDHRRRRC